MSEKEGVKTPLNYEKIVKELVIPRYAMKLGINLIKREMNKDPKVLEVREKRSAINSMIKEMLDKLSKGEKIDFNEFRKLREQYKELGELLNEVKKPYTNKIKPLQIFVRRYDNTIIKVLNIKPSTEVFFLPKLK